MNNKRIVELFTEIANKINPMGTFIWNTRTLAATDYNKPMPQIHLYPIRFNSPAYEASTEQASILMGFWAQDGVDSTPDEKLATIEAMQTLADKFKAELEKTSSVMIQGNYTDEPQEKHYQGNLIGWALSFNLIITKPC
jgi:hypothetical protein